MLSKPELEQLYVKHRRSVSYIAKLFKCSENQVNYWLRQYGISKRTISDAMYAKHNPKGDPFKAMRPRSIKDALMLGMGIGLYWAGGSKNNRLSVRISNTDHRLIKQFMTFLTDIFSIDAAKLRFGLQIFDTEDSDRAIEFWARELHISKEQFQKPVLVPVRNPSVKKNNGVLTLYYHNKKLQSIICKMIENM